MLLNAQGEPLLSEKVTVPTGAVTVLDIHGPQREKSWQEAIDQLAPQNDKLTWLKLVWVAGDFWQPIERWVIYQMYPKGVIPFGIDLADLRGNDPRTYAGDYDTKLQRFVHLKHISIDRIQWRLYQETGCYGFPFWVVQGTQGGHLRRFTHVQSALSKLMGGWTEPPAPGDLPYAVPDSRTWAGIKQHDDLANYEGLIAFHLRSPEMVQGDEAEKAERMKQKMWNQLKSQQEGLWDDEKKAIREIRELAPHGVGKAKGGLDYEEMERRFVQD